MVKYSQENPKVRNVVKRPPETPHNDTPKKVGTPQGGTDYRVSPTKAPMTS